MKKRIKKAFAGIMALASLTVGVTGINASAYYKYSWEQSWRVYTNSYPSAPDVTSATYSVTIPTSSYALDFYCHTFSGNSTAKCSLTNSALVYGTNSATLSASGEMSSINFNNDWLSLNGGSARVGFKVQMMYANVQNNANIAGVAY